LCDGDWTAKSTRKQTQERSRQKGPKNNKMN